MRIQTRLWFLVLLPALFGIMFYLMYVWKEVRLNQAETERKTATIIIRHALELELLLNDFIRHPKQKRSLEQWMEKHKSIAIFLSKTRVAPENRDDLENLHRLFVNLRQLFTDKLWRLKSGEVTGNVTYLTDDRTFDVMMLTTHQLAMEALAFGQKTGEKHREVQSVTDRILLATATGMTLLLVALAFFIGRHILHSMQRLKTGSEIIGTGNLSYRLTGLGKDEIGEVGEAFNAMTEKLRTITASRDELDRQIEERKKAENDLTQNQVYLRKILDSQSNIVVISESDRLIDANRAFFTFFPQYDSLNSFLLEHNCICDLFEKVERPGFLYSRKDGKNWIGVMRDEPDILHKAMIIKEGSGHIFTVHSETIELESGRHNIITFSDITELENYQLRLEQKVHEEVEKRRVKETQILQQSRTAQMGEMITNISHHWRQPLNIIGLNVQEIKDAQEYGELTPAHLHEVVAQTMSVLTKMSATLDQFREFAAAQPQWGVFTVATPLKRVLELMQPEMESRFITIRTDLDETLRLYGDEKVLGQILYNILNNAREALTEKKVLEKEITLTLKQNGPDAMEITVGDTGGGIDTAIIPRIFDPFFTTKERSNKTGTGLYFAKTLLESELGGIIQASNTAKGALFTITLPLNTIQNKEE